MSNVNVGELCSNLTLYTKAQLLLLIGDVAADCTHKRHGNGTNNPCYCAHFRCGL